MTTSFLTLRGREPGRRALAHEASGRRPVPAGDTEQRLPARGLHGIRVQSDVDTSPSLGRFKAASSEARPGQWLFLKVFQKILTGRWSWEPLAACISLSRRKTEPSDSRTRPNRPLICMPLGPGTALATTSRGPVRAKHVTCFYTQYPKTPEVDIISPVCKSFLLCYG